MNVNPQEQGMCPFCPIVWGDQRQSKIMDDFWGHPANIGGIRSCAACATVVSIEGDEEGYVRELREKQATA